MKIISSRVSKTVFHKCFCVSILPFSSVADRNVPKKRVSVAIIGGGLGGLALAQHLKLNSELKVTVYERDKTPMHRSQGYQIGLQMQGLDTLKLLNLKGFDELINENPLKGFLIADKNLDPVVRFPTSRSSLVNRWKLRDLLLQDLHVEWNKRLLGYALEKDEVIAYFDDGSKIRANILVGADGVNSVVRAQYRPDLLFKTVPNTAIAGFYELTPETKLKIPSIVSTILDQNNLGRISLMHSHSLLIMKFLSAAGNKQITTTPCVDNNSSNNPNHLTNKEYILWSISFNNAISEKIYGPFPSSTDSLDGNTIHVQALTNTLLHRFQFAGDSISPEIIHLLHSTPMENILPMKESRMLAYDHPSYQEDWKRVYQPHELTTNIEESSGAYAPQIVLLGDALHPMTTHAGLGANTALQDAQDLAMIFQHPTMGLQEGLQGWTRYGHVQYEKKVFQRGMKAVKTSYENTLRIHADEEAAAKGMKILRGMGLLMKAFNWVTKGSFSV